MLSFSVSAHAISIQFNITMGAYATGARAAGEAYGMNRGDIRDGRHDHAEGPWSLASPLAWGVPIENSDPLIGNDSSGFNMPDGLLYKLYKAFGAGPMSSDGSNPEGPMFETSLGDDINTADTRGSSTDPDAIADFLNAIGFTTTDWQPSSDHAPVADHQAPVPPGPSITRRNTRECLQSHHDQKRGVQENLCAEGIGFAGSGSGAARRGSGGGAAPGVGGGGGGNGSYRNVIGGADGIGSGGGGGGVGSSGGGGTGNNGGNGNDGGGGHSGNPTVIGGDEGGGSGNSDHGEEGGSGGGIPAEVRIVPEPAPLALLVLGFAGMYVVRSRNSLRPGGI